MNGLVTFELAAFEVSHLVRNDIILQEGMIRELEPITNCTMINLFINSNIIAVML